VEPREILKFIEAHGFGQAEYGFICSHSSRGIKRLHHGNRTGP
jgi:hypothetical protein